MESFFRKFHDFLLAGTLSRSDQLKQKEVHMVVETFLIAPGACQVYATCQLHSAENIKKKRPRKAHF